jgi:hypothetical protein
MRHLLTITTALLLLVPATRPGFAQGAGSEWDSLKQEAMELYRAGDYGQAVVVAKRALEVAENNVGPNHPDVATSLTLLAMLYKDQGQSESAQAEPLYQRALAITEKALGPDHPAVAMTLTNLAMLYMIQGQYAQAVPLYQRQLAITEQALGPDHLGVAMILPILGMLYANQGQYAQAEPLYQRALATTWPCSTRTKASTRRPSRSTGGRWRLMRKFLVPIILMWQETWTTWWHCIELHNEKRKPKHLSSGRPVSERSQHQWQRHRPWPRSQSLCSPPRVSPSPPVSRTE